MEIDPYLESYVRWCESVNDEMGIIVAANGVVVSGNIVSEAEYIEGLVSLYTGTTVESWVATPGRNSETEGLPRYFHLKDPLLRVSNMGGDISVRWWRGRLDTVDGYTFGRLGRVET